MSSVGFALGVARSLVLLVLVSPLEGLNFRKHKVYNYLYIIDSILESMPLPGSVHITINSGGERWKRERHEK